MRSKVFFLALAAILAVSARPGFAQESLDFSDETVRVNYSLGYQIGGDFKRQGVEMDPEAVIQGIADALSGAQPKLSQPEMHQTLVALKRRIETEQRVRQGAESEAIRQAGIAFLDENETKEGVQVTASGLQYKVIEEGSGRSPQPGDSVRVDYRGTTVDGHEFDSSYRRGEPGQFKVGGVIPGWTEGLQLMKEGGRYELYIPSELAYGMRGPLAGQALIFRMELLEVVTATESEEISEQAVPGT
jgi:FKBP-type peptidyl-prolyl cis-trans isomerase FklB